MLRLTDPTISNPISNITHATVVQAEAFRDLEHRCGIDGATSNAMPSTASLTRRRRKRKQAFYFSDDLIWNCSPSNRAVVVGYMGRLRWEYLDVLWAVVIADLVDVVDNFARSQRTAKVLLCDQQTTTDKPLLVGSRMPGTPQQQITFSDRHPAIPQRHVQSALSHTVNNGMSRTVRM